jgi:hypothetical protein
MQHSANEVSHLNSNWHGLKANDRCHPITGKYLSMCEHFLPVVEFRTGDEPAGAWLRVSSFLIPIVVGLALLGWAAVELAK